MSDTDLELLASYTGHRAEDAFAEIVRRHLDLVHSAALLRFSRTNPCTNFFATHLSLSRWTYIALQCNHAEA